jgi:hypothetical protein
MLCEKHVCLRWPHDPEDQHHAGDHAEGVNGERSFCGFSRRFDENRLEPGGLSLPEQGISGLTRRQK